MNRILAATSATALVVALAACSAGPTAGGGAALFDPADLVTATPAGTSAVDSVRWAIATGEPRSLDPVKAGTDSEFVAVANLCENLLTLTPEFSVEPGIATSAEWAGDTTFVIDLRDDVTFWDGAPVTAEDVAFSLQRNMDPATGSVNIGLFAGVAAVTVTGPLQVTIEFMIPDTQFRNALATTAGAVVQQAFVEAAGEGFGTARGGVMCTGPFAFESWTAGTRIITTANGDYWNGSPLVEQLELVFIPDSSTLTSALTSGEVDGAYDVPSSSSASFEASDSGTLYIGPSTGTLSFGPATDSGPAADPRVREALDLAINKEQFVMSVLKGYGSTSKTFNPPLTYTGLEEASVYADGYDALPEKPYDLDRAKELIEEADLERTDLVYAIPAGSQELLQAAVIVQAAGKDIGLDIQITQLQPVDFGGLFYNPAAREGIDFVGTMGYLNAPGPIVNASFFTLPAPRGLFNWSGYENPEVTRLLSEASVSTDPGDAAAKFVEAQAIFDNDRLQVTLGLKYASVFLSNELTGVPASFAYIGSPWALNLGGR